MCHPTPELRLVVNVHVPDDVPPASIIEQLVRDLRENLDRAIPRRQDRPALGEDPHSPST